MINKSQTVSSPAPQPANLIVATGIFNCRWTGGLSEREKINPDSAGSAALAGAQRILAENETDLLQFPPLRAMWSLHGVLSGFNARRAVFGCPNLKTGHRLFQAYRRQRAEEFQSFLR
jgi:hypothetical protein